MDLSLIIDSISLIPLETNDSSLIKKVVGVVLKNECYYINDNLKNIFVFDKCGRFLRSTQGYRRNGPNGYVSLSDFQVLDNGNIEIFDALSYKLKEYSTSMRIVNALELPKDILPSSQYERLNEDSILFVSNLTKNSSLKLYSKSNRKILKKIVDEQGNSFVKVTNSLQKIDGIIYYSPPYPSNDLYVINGLMDKDLVFRLDFGEYNFGMEKLPEGLDKRYSAKYMQEHDYAYPYSKYDLPTCTIAFFEFRQRLHVAFRSKLSNEMFVLKNEFNKKRQLLIPSFVQGNTLYYVSEPDYLPYVIDTTLMNRNDMDKMKLIQETDNPIIVAYKVKTLL